MPDFIVSGVQGSAKVTLKKGSEDLLSETMFKSERGLVIDVKKVVLRTMAISGAICGITGLLIVGGTDHAIASNTADGRGFTAIMVSWLAKFNPLIMILTTFLLVFLGRGAEDVSTKFGLNSSFTDIITGIILFFIIGCEFFIQYKININEKYKHIFNRKEGV